MCKAKDIQGKGICNFFQHTEYRGIHRFSSATQTEAVECKSCLVHKSRVDLKIWTEIKIFSRTEVSEPFIWDSAFRHAPLLSISVSKSYSCVCLIHGSLRLLWVMSVFFPSWRGWDWELRCLRKSQEFYFLAKGLKSKSLIIDFYQVMSCHLLKLLFPCFFETLYLSTSTSNALLDEHSRILYSLMCSHL